MHSVTIDELGDKASFFLNAAEMIAIMQHDRTVGYFIPSKDKDSPAARESREQLGIVIERVLKKTGLTEDELAEELSIG